MSLILEALRKSEAERRRGQTPDLLTDAMPVAPVAGRAPPNWTVLLPVIGAGLITLLLVAWWLRPSAEPVLRGDAANGASASDASASASHTAPPLSPPNVRTQPRLAPRVLKPSAPAAAATASAFKPVAPPTDATAEPPAATARNRSSSPASAEPQPASPTPAQVASAGQAGPAPVLADTPVFASPDAPVKLSDLSADDREQLPILKVSMHMWSPDAGNRFAIIDGTRVNEGDRVGEATIEAIRQDSIMLSWRGRQIRLPIR